MLKKLFQKGQRVKGFGKIRKGRFFIHDGGRFQKLKKEGCCGVNAIREDGTKWGIGNGVKVISP